jgi:hypothetical protein
MNRCQCINTLSSPFPEEQHNHCTQKNHYYWWKSCATFNLGSAPLSSSQWQPNFEISAQRHWFGYEMIEDSLTASACLSRTRNKFLPRGTNLIKCGRDHGQLPFESDESGWHTSIIGCSSVPQWRCRCISCISVKEKSCISVKEKFYFASHDQWVFVSSCSIWYLQSCLKSQMNWWWLSSTASVI